MPQSGQKLISRFFTDFTSPANGCHMLNLQLRVNQLRGVRAHSNTHSPVYMRYHTPLTSPACSTWAIRHLSPLSHAHGGRKKSHLQLIRNRSYHLPLCSPSMCYTTQQVPVSGIAQTRGGCLFCKACGSHKCGKH